MAIDDRERAVAAWWKKSNLSAGTIVVYLQWVRRFRKYCEKLKLAESGQLTEDGVRRFTRAYSGPRLKKRRGSLNTRNVANNALHAWACALAALGTPMPLWRERRQPRLSHLLEEYCHYRQATTASPTER